MIRIQRKIVFSLAASLTMLLGSCGTDFTSVKNFGDNAEKVKAASDSFADDIYQSCLRRTRFISLIPDNGISTQSKRRESCADVELPDSQRFKEAVMVLVNYMTALSLIAGGEGLSLDSSIDNLGSSIKDVSVRGKSLDASAVDGGNKILKVLFALITKQIRQDALQKAIVCSNQPIHQYITGNDVPATGKDGVAQNKPVIGGLIFLIEEGYNQGTLGIEEESIKLYYEPYFAFLNRLGNDRNITQEKYQQILAGITVGQSLTSDYNKAIDTVSEKRTAARAFSKILLITAQTHNQLRKEFEEGLDAREINNLCKFDQEVTFKKIDEKKLTRIQKILKEYLTSVKPLFEQFDRTF